jgi:hypothetical protein
MGFGKGDESIDVDNENDLPTPNKPGKPNSKYNFWPKGGRNDVPKTERQTGPDGRPTHDGHNYGPGPGHGPNGWPHGHDWNGKPGPG